MAIKGVRVLTFSSMEMRAFGGLYYETKKKLMWHYTNVSSTWSSMLPVMAFVYGTIKWGEWKYAQDQLSHRD